MKKINLLLCSVLVMFSLLGASAQKLEVSQRTIDFGAIEISKSSVKIVRINNTGDKPLVIKSITVDCNCTKLQWKKAPVMPGKSVDLKITYTPEEKGVFHKKIRIISNVDPQVIVVKGTSK